MMYVAGIYQNSLARSPWRNWEAEAEGVVMFPLHFNKQSLPEN